MNNPYKNISTALINIIPEYTNSIKFEKYADAFKKQNNLSNDELNALRHIGASLYYSNKYNPSIAKLYGDWNEKWSNGDIYDDTVIDQFNNRLGRLYYKDYNSEIMEDAIKNAYDLIQKKLGAMNYLDTLPKKEL